MLALSMEKDTKDLLHMDYVNMLKQENEEGGGGCENEVPRAWELEYEHVHGQTDSAE